MWDTACNEIDSALTKAAGESEIGAGVFLKQLMTSSMAQADMIGRVHLDGDGVNAPLVRARQRLAWASAFHQRLGAATLYWLRALHPSCARRVAIGVGTEILHYCVPHSSAGWGVRIADSGTVSYTAVGTAADLAGLQIGDTILQIGAEGSAIDVSSSSEVVGAIRALIESAAGTASDGTPGPQEFSVAISRPVAPKASNIAVSLMMVKTEKEAGERFARAWAQNWRPPLPGTMRDDPTGKVVLKSQEVEDLARWPESARDFSRLCKQQGSVVLLCPAAVGSATEQLVPLDASIRAVFESTTGRETMGTGASVDNCSSSSLSGHSHMDDSEACFTVLQKVIRDWFEQCGITPLPEAEELTRVSRLIVYNLTVKPAMEVCIACKVFPPAMYQPRFLLGCSAGPGCRAALRVFTYGFVGGPVLGDRPDTKATPYLLRLCSSNLLANAKQPVAEPPAPRAASSGSSMLQYQPYCVHYTCQVTAAKRAATAVTADVASWLPEKLKATGPDSWTWPLAIPYLSTDMPSSVDSSAVPAPQVALPVHQTPPVAQEDHGRLPVRIPSSAPPPIARPGAAAVARSRTGPNKAARPVEMELRPEPGQSYGMDISTRAQVTAFRRSPSGGSCVAERAGVEIGSIITHVDGLPVSTDLDIVAHLRNPDVARRGCCVFTFALPRKQALE